MQRNRGSRVLNSYKKTKLEDEMLKDINDFNDV